jgi:hypothetical protein
LAIASSIRCAIAGSTAIGCAPAASIINRMSFRAIVNSKSR